MQRQLRQTQDWRSRARPAGSLTTTRSYCAGGRQGNHPLQPGSTEQGLGLENAVLGLPIPLTKTCAIVSISGCRRICPV